MKKPNVEKCPCCEAEVRNARPSCEDQRYNDRNELATYNFFWICNICGCKWHHTLKEDEVAR